MGSVHPDLYIRKLDILYVQADNSYIDQRQGNEMNLMQLQDKLVADILHAERTMTPCYGNQRKSIRAAAERFDKTLKQLGYSDGIRKALSDDCYDMAELELRASIVLESA